MASECDCSYGTEKTNGEIRGFHHLSLEEEEEEDVRSPVRSEGDDIEESFAARETCLLLTYSIRMYIYINLKT